MPLSFLTESQFKKCESLLMDAVNKTESVFALLSNHAGLVVVHVARDSKNYQIAIDDFSILAAANMSAVSEMAKTIGEEEGFTSMLLEGEKLSHYILSVNKHYILQFLFPSTVKAGKVRYYASQVQQSLIDIFTIDSLNEDLSSIFDHDYFAALDEQIEKALSSLSNDDKQKT